jgi:hypothetical protein
MIRPAAVTAVIPAQRTGSPDTKAAAARSAQAFAVTVHDPGCNHAGEAFRTHRATATGGTR